MKLKYALTCYAVFIMAVACSSSQATNKEILFHGDMCDASAAVAIDATLFIVANDEDNILRIYRNNKNGGPVDSYDLTRFLELDRKHPEADIEGATKIGDRIFWITSHGSNKNGKKRSSRHRLFATDIQKDKTNVTIKPIGLPYINLIKEVSIAPQFKQFNLNIAAKQPPKDFGALNIEGLCATPEGKLLIAFRNPIPEGKALIIPLDNPQAVIKGKTAVFGNPIQLALDNLGIRSIEYFPPKKIYLIVAGPYHGKGNFKLFQWSGSPSDDPKHIKKVNFDNLNPEALIVYPSKRSDIQILSDDGTKEVNGNQCKNVDMKLRSFRSAWFSL